MFLLKWNLNTQTSQGASHLADQRNGNSIRVDIVFYYSPGQSSGSFICTFKLFILSFVKPAAWLEAWAGLLQASVLSVMYGAIISISVKKIWIPVQDVILNIQSWMLMQTKQIWVFFFLTKIDVFGLCHWRIHDVWAQWVAQVENKTHCNFK